MTEDTSREDIVRHGVHCGPGILDDHVGDLRAVVPDASGIVDAYRNGDKGLHVRVRVAEREPKDFGDSCSSGGDSGVWAGVLI